MERSERRAPTPEACYGILGLPHTATHREVQAAYRRLAFRHHPDIAGDDAAARSEFSRITEAYRTIATLDRLRGRVKSLVGCCCRCGRPEQLFRGMDHRNYCAECLLSARRRLLPAPIYTTMRCFSVIALQALSVLLMVRFAGSGHYAEGWAAAGCMVASLGVLGYFVAKADVIEVAPARRSRRRIRD
ncbi:MAG: J domain-containing protein [Phycisphaerae bacterium]